MISKVFNEHYRITMAKYPNGYFDWAICDIPYGINIGNMAFLKEKKTTVKQRNGTRLQPRNSKSGYSLKDWDKETPPQEYFDELRRISKHQIIFGVEYVNWNGLGKGRIKWNKGVPAGVSFKDYEMAYCSAIEHTHEIDLLWSGMMQAKSLSEPMTQQGNKQLNEKRIHPCYKPMLLYYKIMLDFGFAGMKVYDSHLGGGAIRIAADKFGVSEFIASEIDTEYYIKQEAKYQEYASQMVLSF